MSKIPSIRKWFRRAQRAPIQTRKRLHQRHQVKLQLQQLEDRLAPAAYTWDNGAGILSITLGTGENLTIAESGGSRTFTLDANSFTQNGGDPAPGGGSATLTFAATDNIGSSISVDNAGADVGTNNVAFAGGTITSATITVAATTAMTTSAIDVTGATTLAGNVSLTSNGAGITDSS